LIDPNNAVISVQRQCELVGLPRSSYYYEPAEESPLNLELMEVIDEQYTRRPFYGVPRMTEVLRSMGYAIGRKRIARLMRLMGLQAIYPKKNLSKAAPGHKSSLICSQGWPLTVPTMSGPQT